MSTAILAATLLSGCPKERWTEVSREDILARLRAPLDPTQGMSGTVRVEAAAPGQVRKGRVYFAVRGAGALLLEAVTPSDDTLATLVMSGERFIVFERGERACRSGRPCAANVARVLPVYLDGPGVVRLLHGRPPLVAGAASELRRDEEKRRYGITLTAPGGVRQTLEFSPDGRDLLRATLGRQGVRRLDLRYGRYAPGPHGLRLPRRVEIERPAARVRIKLRVVDLAVLEERPGTFDTRCPPGTVEEPSSCGP